VEAIVAPRFSVTLGSELGLVAWHVPDVTLRAGALALFGLESLTASRRLFPAPGGDSKLWRGILAYELSLSFDRIARLLGRHGGLELSLGYYHESEHHTASNDPVTPGVGPDDPDLRGRPQLGNSLSLDVASRFEPRGGLETILRQQAKLFVNGTAQASEPFRAGTSTELTLQVHELLDGITPFWSTAAELLLAQGRAPARSLRTLLGVALPGSKGELRLYASFDEGAEKGLLMSQRQAALGAGFRYTPFSPAWP
jgi:hypothetical protein